jgi:hypothetical protein
MNSSLEETLRQQWGHTPAPQRSEVYARRNKNGQGKSWAAGVEGLQKQLDANYQNDKKLIDNNKRVSEFDDLFTDLANVFMGMGTKQKFDVTVWNEFCERAEYAIKDGTNQGFEARDGLILENREEVRKCMQTVTDLKRSITKQQSIERNKMGYKGFDPRDNWQVARDIERDELIPRMEDLVLNLTRWLRMYNERKEHTQAHQVRSEAYAIEIEYLNGKIEDLKFNQEEEPGKKKKSEQLRVGGKGKGGKGKAKVKGGNGKGGKTAEGANAEQ